MALPEHVRERLKEHAVKNKGRTNLNGLDKVLGLVALDYAQEQDSSTLDRWQLWADGWISEFGQPFSVRGVKTRYDEGHTIRNRHNVKCPWARLSYAPQWLKDELGDRCRKYLTGYSENYTMRNPGVGTRIRMAKTSTLYPDQVGEVRGIGSYRLEVVFGDGPGFQLIDRRSAGLRWVTIA